MNKLQLFHSDLLFHTLSISFPAKEDIMTNPQQLPTKSLSYIVYQDVACNQIFHTIIYTCCWSKYYNLKKVPCMFALSEGQYHWTDWYAKMRTAYLILNKDIIILHGFTNNIAILIFNYENLFRFCHTANHEQSQLGHWISI